MTLLLLHFWIDSCAQCPFTSVNVFAARTAVIPITDISIAITSTAARLLCTRFIILPPLYFTHTASNLLHNREVTSFGCKFHYLDSLYHFSHNFATAFHPFSQKKEARRLLFITNSHFLYKGVGRLGFYCFNKNSRFPLFQHYIFYKHSLKNER